MADPATRRKSNADGPWFVDETCIACDACRQCGPTIFGEHRDGSSFVRAQPRDEDERTAAARALLACPVGAIGGDAKGLALAQLYPHELDAGVWYCGYNARHSFGGNSYLVDVKGKLLLIDGPRFVAPLVKFIEARGGLAGILLTHGDDVGDADRYAEHFGAPVAIHADDARAAPFASVHWRGTDDAQALAGLDVTVVAVPGHTRGSVMFLAGDRLFTGDSLAWDRERSRMMAFHDACWFSWSEQKKSLARMQHEFTWMLPGHGQRHRASAYDNQSALQNLVARM